MIFLRKVLGTLWFILTLPSLLIALASLICSSPNGCLHSPHDYLVFSLIITAPVFFLFGGFSGWSSTQNTKAKIFLLIPFVHTILLGWIIVSNYS